jgi:hypothetical protein
LSSLLAQAGEGRANPDGVLGGSNRRFHPLTAALSARLGVVAGLLACDAVAAAI